MKTSFLTYYKTILEKVSFDRALFIKEYGKALRNLHATEIDDLNNWLKSNGLIYLPTTAAGKQVDMTPREISRVA